MQKRIRPRSAARCGIGFPMVIRPSFTLGGTGGGIAYNPEEFEEICKRGLDLSPTNELLIEESLIGWKEFEMEVVRDKADNCIIVCSIENLDPMGIHTGDSITVAPAQTLTDKEYQLMRNASIAILREIGVDTGGSNVQFAINPKNGRMVVIEMNPRVSRSLGAGLQGDRLSDRQGRGQAGGRLHARRAAQRHHRRRDAGELRAEHRLRRHQDPALRVREVPRGRPAPDDADEVGGRGDGDRPHLPGELPEGAARPGDRHRRPGRTHEHATARRSSQEIGEAGPGAHPVRRRRVPHRHERWTRSSRRRRSTPGSWRRSRRSSATEQAARRPQRWRACRRPRCASSSARASPTGAWPSCSAPTSTRCARAPRARRAPGLQARRHLRRRVRDADGLHVLDLRRGVRGRADRRARRSWCSAAGRTASARASSSTTAACTPRSRCARTATRPSWSTAIPETVSTDYDTCGPPLLRAGDAGRRARDRRQGKAGRRDRAVRRPDAAEARARPRDAPACRSSAPRPTRSTSPRTASASRSCCTSSACSSRRTAPRAPRRRRWSWRRRSATRWWCGRATCSAAARWRSCTATRTSSATCARRCKVSEKSPVLLDRFLDDAIEVDVDCISDGSEVMIGGIMEHVEQAGVHSGDSACSLPPYSLPAAAAGRAAPPDHADGQGAEGRRPDERAVRDPGRDGGTERRWSTCSKSTRARRAPCRSSRKATGQPLAKIAARCMVGQQLSDQRGTTGGAARGDPAVLQRQGSGVPVQQVPGRRPDPRPRDALDRRGDGRRPHLRRGDAEEPARRRLAPADQGHGLHHGEERRQGARRRGGARTARRSASRSSPPRARRRRSPRPACRCARSTRSRTAGRTSSTWSRPARSSSSSRRSTRRARRSPTRATSAPAALAHRVTYYTSMAGCEAAVEGMKHQDDLARGVAAGTARRTALNCRIARRQPPPGPLRRRLRFGASSSFTGSAMATIPLTAPRRRKAQGRAAAPEDRRAPRRDPGHRRGARAGRPVGERRVRGGQGQAGLHRRPHPRDREQARRRADHRPGDARRRRPRGVRRDRRSRKRKPAARR